MGWTRGQAYSQDLRDRVLASDGAGLKVGQIAERLQVGISYVSKVLRRWRQTGETAARPQRCHVPPKLLNLHRAIGTQVAATPDATIEELHTWLAATHATTASKGIDVQDPGPNGPDAKKKSVHAAE